ncbi:unnamed protein product [Clavelina lepadiformis]|uniref:Ileal sodium/bile acid cotransporter n=1 Tax=Clavelina lepadiformis TaxID=159417 RepID=A0ABP0GKS6_CLALP
MNTTMETTPCATNDSLACTNVTSGMPTGQQPQGDNLQNTIYILTTVIIAIGMVGIGASVYYKTLWKYIKKPKSYLIGVFLQLIIMPPLAWALTKIFVMPQAEALGVFIQGSCPGGVTSNVVVYWVDGIVDLSVAMTGTSTLLALGMMPLWLLIFQKGENLPSSLSIPFDRLAISLAALVVPIFVGMLIRAKLPKHANIISKILIGIASLFIVIMVIVNSVLSRIPWVVTWKQAVVACIMPVIAFLLAYGVTYIPGIKLEGKIKRTIALETAFQNVQIAAAVIQISFGRSPIIVAMILFPLLYYIFQVGYCALVTSFYTLAKRQGWVKFTNEDNNEESKAQEEKKPAGGADNPSFTCTKDVAV